MDTVSALMRTTTDDSVFQGCYRALRSAMQALIVRADSAAMSGSDSSVQACLRLAEPLVGGEAPLYLRLARYYQSKGDSAMARELAGRAGIATPFWVAGPFPNRSVDAVSTDFGPEGKPFSQTETWVVADGRPAGWVPLRYTDPSGFYDFHNVYGGPCCGVCYLFAYVRAPAERDALLLLGHNEPARAWLNDSLIYTSRYYGSPAGDDFCVKVHLRAGVNRLFIKSVQDLVGWRLMVRLADVRGEAMPDVRIGLEPAD
jgi:hypothetical protein